MAYVLADHIISPLGNTSEANYLAVKAGKTGLRSFEAGSRGVAEPFVASLLSEEQKAALPLKEGWSYFERLAYASARQAIQKSGVEVSQENVCLILSTTKGSIESLGLDSDSESKPYLGISAFKISRGLGIVAPPIVVCNACISGLSALILASRLLEEGKYDYAVVCGADVPDRFVISGFQSLKALSTQPCRPFDMERFGLNLGEAAATLVLSRNIPASKSEADSSCLWQIGPGFVKNDAFHISAPSKTGDGLYACLQAVEDYVDSADLAFVNAHGTATLFNDQMESVAIRRAGLTDVPVNALKGYFGHTLGAAGILETIVSMKAIDDHTILGTRGFEELGVSGKIDVVASNRTTDKHSFIKMLSGFGGCNAAMVVTRSELARQKDVSTSKHLQKTHHVRICPTGVEVDGALIEIEMTPEHPDMLTALYKQHIDNYPKFYKMDKLCRLGFVASELLAKLAPSQDRAIVLFNHSSSIYSDHRYLESIADKANYYPSPSIFVYTLPNIVTGEIAIRKGWHSETSFYVLTEKDESLMDQVLQATFSDAAVKQALTGWIDYEDETHYEADFYLVE